jgi:acetylornithine deacetylase/succinyl-diaminopimelate desuccinylase-like protein
MLRLAAAMAALFALLIPAAQRYPSYFTGKIAAHPRVQQALARIEAREEQIITDWIRTAEIPAPSGQESERTRYIRTQLEKLRFQSIRVDPAGNLVAVRKGQGGGGAATVFAAHLDTVFPKSTPLKVERDGQTLKCPGIGDNTGNLVALVEVFRALDEAGIKTRGDLIFLATTQEETRLQGMRYWLNTQQVKPDLLVAVDIPLGMVWYGALRLAAMRFVYTSTGAHTLVSRGEPNPVRAVARAVQGMYDIELPEPDPSLGPMKLPVINVGKLQAGAVVNAIPQEASFTVDLRSMDSSTQDRLYTQVVAVAKSAADAEKVGFRIEKPEGDDLDYSHALSRAERRQHPIVQTALDVQKHLKLLFAPEPLDVGSTDANVGVSLGIPSIAVGAIRSRDAHMLTESADAKSIVPGARSLLLLAVSLAGLAD